MTTPVHITKRALVGATGFEGEDKLPPAHQLACGAGLARYRDVQAAELRYANRDAVLASINCPDCRKLVEEAQRQRAEIEAGR